MKTKTAQYSNSKTKKMSLKLDFKRITSSGNFIPEIDGLRFIAIVSVVLFHLSRFIIEKDTHQYNDTIDYSFLNFIFSHGHIGVPLFFVISGFILGIPFAKHYIKKEQRVSIKKYFLRRLTRLEPPYILIMSLLLFGAVYVARAISLDEGIKSYFSSIFYSHNLIYPGDLPHLNCVAWSLEIEVQFYIIAPLISYLFSIKSITTRRLLLFITAFLFLVLNHFISLPFKSLINGSIPKK
ncbi:MAG: acyltransferase [Candidatus Electrothrix sp. AS4_5]|nr:acyltransferase [Candidatus Electrothrix gigas]